MLKDDIYNTVNSILDNQMDITNVNAVPDIDDVQLTFGLTGKRFSNVCFYIDMRGSTKILEKHNANVVIKIHKAFFIIILKIVNSLNGEVRSFNGDSVLAFFMGNDSNAIDSAIKAAMQIKYLMLVDENCLKNKVFNKYDTEIDIGIGLDIGTTTVAKVGYSAKNSKDLIWIGSNVNHSVKISDNRKNSNTIGITKRLYDNLTNDTKFSKGKNMWQFSYCEYNGNQETIYITSYHWTVS
jgi:class 3 adenylate cyclase